MLIHRPWAVWLAVLVAVFGALAPTVSHALAQGGAPAMMDICASGNASTVPMDAPSGPQSLASPDHCPFCLHAADRVAVLPPPLLTPLLVPGDKPEPVVQPVFFYSTYLAHAPPPRGPPVFQMLLNS
jgi:hypothetical protein